MAPEIPFTKDASTDQFLSFFLECFDKDLVKSFIQIGEYDIDFETLNTFLHSEMVTNRLRNQWEKEKPSKWTGRSIELAISETSGYLFAGIRGDIQIFDRNGQGKFQDLELNEVNQIRKNTEFMEDFFEIRLRIIKKKALLEYFDGIN